MRDGPAAVVPGHPIGTGDGATLAFLAGTWRLRRILYDDRLGLRGSFRGRAVVVPDPDDGELLVAADVAADIAADVAADIPAPAAASEQPLAGVDVHERSRAGGATYREDGVLRWPGYRGPAGRRLRYEPLPSGGLQVRFSDGRPFHELDLRRGSCHVAHPCAPDLYRGTTALRGPDRFLQIWQVTGPDTDLRIVSRYTRAPEGTIRRPPAPVARR